MEGFQDEGNKKTMIIIAIVIIVAIIGYFVWKNKQAKKLDTGSQGAPKTGVNSVKVIEIPKDTLAVGSKGESVKKIQTKLGIVADGIFGTKTKEAVLKAGMTYPIPKAEVEKLTGSPLDIYVQEVKDVVKGLDTIGTGIGQVAKAPFTAVGSLWDWTKSLFK